MSTGCPECRPPRRLGSDVRIRKVYRVGPALFVLCAIAALGDTFYWSSYHAYFAALGNHQHRGSELGAREAIAAVAGIVSPLMTGIMLVALGPLVAFGSAAVLQVSAALPLLFTPEVAVGLLPLGAAANAPVRTPGGRRADCSWPGNTR